MHFIQGTYGFPDGDLPPIIPPTKTDFPGSSWPYRDRAVTVRASRGGASCGRILWGGGDPEFSIVEGMTIGGGNGPMHGAGRGAGGALA